MQCFHYLANESTGACALHAVIYICVVQCFVGAFLEMYTVVATAVAALQQPQSTVPNRVAQRQSDFGTLFKML